MMDEQVEELIVEAIEALKRGDTEAALLVLERTVRPKYESVEHAIGAHAMFNGDGPKDHVHDFFAKGLGHQIGALA
ncbi:hypothetical protein HLI01_09010 [Rhizobium laguerreae]|uniref:hypothetical protein n=1 Tax=Rhizobium laguerreae TaxID=1076926 RepID=UPI0014789340|nr:hypothetical protein [Rhizobium laguerreae]NNH56946.1 hypothetical protein [Rhizobium laguerreae]